MNVIIFSKDRAAQLDLLLRSMPQWNNNILYTCSTDEFAEGYDILETQYDNFFIRQANFKDDLLRFIQPHERFTVFFTDDDVFINDMPANSPQMYEMMNSSHVACLSLRLNPRMTYCYTLNRPMRHPHFHKYNTWQWQRGDADFGYPMSLDGHIFPTCDILPLLQRLEYNNPNELEGRLATNPSHRPKMVCFDKSVIVNNPINRVQNTVPNRHGDISAEWLNEQFLQGKRIKLEPFLGYEPNACHVELPIIME